jgi:hypothetical protein
MEIIKDWFSFNNESNKDESLGKQILEYLKKYKPNYNTSNDYKKANITKSMDSNKFTFFSNKIFFKEVEKVNPKTKKKEKVLVSTGEYRIDIAKISEIKSESDQYQVFISKVLKTRNTNSTDNKGLLRFLNPKYRDNINTKESDEKKDIGPEEKRLQIKKQLAEKIYNEAEKIWKLTNKNDKSDAKGGTEPKKSIFKWK